MVIALAELGSPKIPSRVPRGLLTSKELDPDFVAFNSENRRYHFPRRTYLPFRGALLQRDPRWKPQHGFLYLYGLGEMNPARFVDPSGLMSVTSSGCARCCCCAENLRLAFIKPTSERPEDKMGTWVGHTFQLLADLYYHEYSGGGDDPISVFNDDCQLEWMEWTSDPYMYSRRPVLDKAGKPVLDEKGQPLEEKKWTPKGEWFDLKLHTRSIFTDWYDRLAKHPCPGPDPNIPITDPPGVGSSGVAQKSYKRDLYFAITLKSSPNCIKLKYCSTEAIIWYFAQHIVTDADGKPVPGKTTFEKGLGEGAPDAPSIR